MLPQLLRDTDVRNLLPLLACTRLEVLECSEFDGVDDQISQLYQACPELDIRFEDSDDDSEEDDEDGADDDWDEDEGGEDDGGWL